MLGNHCKPKLNLLFNWHKFTLSALKSGRGFDKKLGDRSL